MRATLRRVFDAHFHIIDPKFPLVPNKGYLPPAFTPHDYKNTACVPPLNVASGAIVSGSFQAYDQTYLEAALKTLGPEFVGVAQVPLLLRYCFSGDQLLRDDPATAIMAKRPFGGRERGREGGLVSRIRDGGRR
jgi:hypothetical protein